VGVERVEVKRPWIVGGSRRLVKRSINKKKHAGPPTEKGKQIEAVFPGGGRGKKRKHRPWQGRGIRTGGAGYWKGWEEKRCREMRMGES